MKKGKLLTLLPLMLLPLGLTSCRSNVMTIGICQLVKHPALDKATEGFKKAVIEGLGEGKVKIDVQEAAGDSATCVTICNSFVSKKVSLIMANATPALQAAANSTKNIPVLGTSITEYGVALNLKDFNGTVGGNVSGTSDLAPLDGQANMFDELLPEAKKIGLLYCSAEANSKYQIDTVKGFLEEKGLETSVITFAESSQLSSVLTAGITNVDALYIPTDNTCADNTSIIDSICRPAKMPIICGEENICAGCGIATLSIDYYNLGVKTGEMAVEILRDGKDISQMPIAYDNNPVKKFNKQICQELGITVPSSYVEIA